MVQTYVFVCVFFFFSKESETNVVSGRVLVGETFESVSRGKVRRSCLQGRD